MTAKALCVGINKFANLPQASWLNGCVNDAEDMAAMLLKRPDFGPNDVTVLLEAEATKAKVMAALTKLVKDDAVDHIVFSFSSHGTQVPDKNGDEKVDHVDEAFACYDIDQSGRDWDRNTVIIDDELKTGVEDRRRRPGILHKLCAPAARMHHSLGQRSGQQGYQVCPVHAEVRGVRAIRLR